MNKKKMSLFYIIELILILYLIVTLSIYIFQRKLLYHPNINSYLKGDGLIHSFENINIKTFFAPNHTFDKNTLFVAQSLRNRKTIMLVLGC